MTNPAPGRDQSRGSMSQPRDTICRSATVESTAADQPPPGARNSLGATPADVGEGRVGVGDLLADCRGVTAVKHQRSTMVRGARADTWSAPAVLLFLAEVAIDNV